MPKTSRNFYRHSKTGEVFAIARQWDGTLVGSCGPLTENDLRDLDSYEYTPQRNNWLKDASDKLILCV